MRVGSVTLTTDELARALREFLANQHDMRDMPDYIRVCSHKSTVFVLDVEGGDLSQAKIEFGGNPSCKHKLT